MKKSLCYCWWGAAALVSASVNAQATRSDDQALRELVLQEVREQAIDKTPEVQIAVRAAQEAVLIRAWEKHVLASQPVTAAMKESIYRDLSALLGDKEYKVLHVLLSDEKAAKVLVARLKETPDWNGVDPHTLLSPDTKVRANRTGWINLSAIAQEFRPQVRAMKAGDVTSQPIQTKEGWHVVGVMDTRPFNMPSAERMDKELQRLAEAKIIEQHLRERRNGLARK